MYCSKLTNVGRYLHVHYVIFIHCKSNLLIAKPVKSNMKWTYRDRHEFPLHEFRENLAFLHYFV